jgi:DNA-binding MarR family transcriptional regulator
MIPFRSHNAAIRWSTNLTIEYELRMWAADSQPRLPFSMKLPSPNVARGLMTASRAAAAAVVARLAQRGYVDFPFASASLLWLLDEGGTRSTTLAQRAGVTKQAMSQQVKQMELQGYLEQVPDVSDTRAKVVRMTPRGKSVKVACEEVREELNQSIAMRLGKGKASEMEVSLEAATRAFNDIAAES